MTTSESRAALDKAIADALTEAGGKVRSALMSLQAELRKLDEKRELRWGDRVRTACTATGRYLGEYRGRRLALFVSAMDNSVNIDEVKPDGEPPSATLPVPTDRELEAATNGIRRGQQLAAIRPAGGQ